MGQLGDAATQRQNVWLGVLLPVIIAGAALSVSGAFSVPPLLVALGLGLLMRPLAASVSPGVNFASRRVIELGVALLGFKVTAAILMQAGFSILVLVVVAMAVTIAASLAFAKLLRLPYAHGFLVGGATAICGSSACMAIGSLLPRSKQTELGISVTIVGTTLLSSAAMIAYPFGVALLGLNDHAAGIVLGGSIHNVPQAIGAGLSFSEDAGATATITKLIRVTMLLPVAAGVMALVPLLCGPSAIGERKSIGQIVPWFIPAFALFLAINSTGWIAAPVRDTLAAASQLCLIVGIAAIGLKTPFKGLVAGGARPLILIGLSALVLLAILLIGVSLV
ncbi:MAG: putative sulfate exporter family transporter [Alphaproteobacteria bacterium]